MNMPASRPMIGVTNHFDILIEHDPVQDIIDRLDNFVEVMDQDHENLVNAGIQNAIHYLADDINALQEVGNINQVEELLDLLDTQISANEINIRDIQDIINDLWQAAREPQAVIASSVVEVVYNHHNIAQFLYNDQFIKADDKALPISFNFSDSYQPLTDSNLAEAIGIMSVIQSYIVFSG